MTPSSGIGNQYLRLVADLGGVLRDKCVQLYSCRFSRQDYTLHQHIILLVLRSKERKPYRDFCQWLGVASEIREALNLRQVPHYTTLQKQASRLPPGFLEALMAWIGLSKIQKSEIVAIDGTGFSLDFSSHHYCQRIGRKDKHRNYLKTSLTAEVNDQILIGARCRLKRRHDNHDFQPLMRKTRKRLKFETLVADKGYDSEDNLEFVEDELHATPIIPPKYADKPPDKTRGTRRTKLKLHFPIEKYSHRNKIESIISVIKRKYGSTIHSRTHNE